MIIIIIIIIITIIKIIIIIISIIINMFNNIIISMICSIITIRFTNPFQTLLEGSLLCSTRDSGRARARFTTSVSVSSSRRLHKKCFRRTSPTLLLQWPPRQLHRFRGSALGVVHRLHLSAHFCAQNTFKDSQRIESQKKTKND